MKKALEINVTEKLKALYLIPSIDLPKMIPTFIFGQVVIYVYKKRYCACDKERKCPLLNEETRSCKYFGHLEEYRLPVQRDLTAAYSEPNVEQIIKFEHETRLVRDPICISLFGGYLD